MSLGNACCVSIIGKWSPPEFLSNDIVEGGNDPNTFRNEVQLASNSKVIVLDVGEKVTVW
jgi:hypothetical protein